MLNENYCIYITLNTSTITVKTGLPLINPSSKHNTYSKFGVYKFEHGIPTVIKRKKDNESVRGPPQISPNPGICRNIIGWAKLSLFFFLSVGRSRSDNRPLYLAIQNGIIIITVLRMETAYKGTVCYCSGFAYFRVDQHNSDAKAVGISLMLRMEVCQRKANG